MQEEGTIASLAKEKGFGFIKVEGMEKDLFFHMNELVDVKFDDLKEGDRLKFTVGESPKGPQATQVSMA